MIIFDGSGFHQQHEFGEIEGRAKIFIKERIAWLVERDFSTYGEFRNPGRGDGSPGKGRIFETDYASSRQMVAWVLHWRQNATVLLKALGFGDNAAILALFDGAESIAMTLENDAVEGEE